MQSSSTNENIASSNGFVYPFPPYIFPFSSSSTSSPSSHTNLHHHLHPHQENPLGLHQDHQFSLLNNFLQPITENTMHLNLGGASIMSSNEDYHHHQQQQQQHQHYVYDDRIDSNIGHHHHPYLANYNKEAKVVPAVGAKKDRHSKIFTAQGFRDRRVRLSIDVARDFFDLQDLLGFDKASKTLEWLLSKSRSAIVDLAKSKCNDNEISPSLWSSNTTENDDVFETGNERKTRKKVKEDVAKQMERALRVKARARARERTKEKKSSSTTTSKMCSSHLSLFNMNEELGSALLTENHEHVPLSGSSHIDRIRSLELNLQKMEASSNCCSPNNNIQFSGSVSTNWEINGGVFAFPSFSAITTNMNLNSTGS